MPSITALMGSGLPARLARIIGFTPTTKAGIGTTQTGAAVLTSNMTAATTTVGQTAFIIPPELPGAGPLMFVNTSSTAALVFPPVGGTIQGGAVNASFSVAQNKPVLFYNSGNQTWWANLSA